MIFRAGVEDEPCSLGLLAGGPLMRVLQGNKATHYPEVDFLIRENPRQVTCQQRQRARSASETPGPHPLS